jgi:D-glycero-D-manno-heptose 1,7-bisphosphate phosphatase
MTDKHPSGAIEAGLFVRRLTDASFAGRPCLFLDRDGVVVEEVDYLHRVEDVALIPGVAEAIAEVNRAGRPVVLVTNQSGIARGLFGWEAFAAVQARMLDLLKARGAGVDMVLACAFHREGSGVFAIADHPWRKPMPGMLLEAARVLAVDLPGSLVIGDKLSDLAAGRAAGMRGGALVLTGHGRHERAGAERMFSAWGAGFEATVAETAAVAIRRWLAA